MRGGASRGEVRWGGRAGAGRWPTSGRGFGGTALAGKGRGRRRQPAGPHAPAQPRRGAGRVGGWVGGGGKALAARPAGRFLTLLGPRVYTPCFRAWAASREARRPACACEPHLCVQIDDVRKAVLLGLKLRHQHLGRGGEGGIGAWAGGRVAAWAKGTWRSNREARGGGGDGRHGEVARKQLRWGGRQRRGAAAVAMPAAAAAAAPATAAGATHRRVVASRLGAPHAAGGRAVEALLHDQVNGRQLAALHSNNNNCSGKAYATRCQGGGGSKAGRAGPAGPGRLLQDGNHARPKALHDSQQQAVRQQHLCLAGCSMHIRDRPCPETCGLSSGGREDGTPCLRLP